MSKNLPEKSQPVEIRVYIEESATEGQLASHTTMGTRQDTKHHTVIELGHGTSLFDQITAD